ncbi:hypothetical protein CHU94_02525 [Rhodoferax sp. TH121]|uniref:sensor domain-containing diguanylate cyclase n=1 Tax=Rhodoferax sp. TH121 TaxID=2022803 RepID=UPI000B96A5BA|nr:diguanylate cyclase [Rhodoferax sp. TH121]OYQ42460.1 hypothetical protein CHU94_02525 [Rhodoferax sp. TH121]
MSAYHLKKLRLHSLRGRLTLWLVGMALLTLLSVGLYVGQLATQQRADSVGQALHATATAAAQLMGASLRERELDIALLSQELHVIQGPLSHPNVLQSLQLRRQARNELVWLGVVDAEGTVVQAVDGLLQGQSVAKRPWFLAGKERVFTGDVHEAVLLAKLLPATATGEPLRFIDFAAPIRGRDGRLLGVVGAHASWSWVTDTVQGAARQAERGTELLIVDRQGNILYPQALVDQAPLQRNPDQQTPYTTVSSNDGSEYLSSEVQVDTQTDNNLGWRIVVRQPLDDAMAPVHALRNRLIWLGVVAALVFGLVALALAHTVSQPIEELADAARRIELREGEPRYPQTTRVLEVQQLEQSIRSMTASLLAREQELETLNHTLEAQVLQRTHALAAANEELERLATHDALTGLHNRRHCDERLAERMAVGQRTGRTFALLVLDADHFKQINDRFGHATGDAVLQQLAQVLRTYTRSTDLLARYGGEEFVVILPENESVDDAVAAAEKIRVAVDKGTFAEVGHVTVSIGVCLWELSDLSVAGLVHRADLALYQAKRLGRNRVEAAPAGQVAPT